MSGVITVFARPAFQAGSSAAAARASYRAVIRDVDAREIWSGPAALDASTVVVEVPARALAEGDYELVLSDGAGREVASYSFGVLR